MNIDADKKSAPEVTIVSDFYPIRLDELQAMALEVVQRRPLEKAELKGQEGYSFFLKELHRENIRSEAELSLR